MHLANGHSALPQNVFSEANLDLLALLVFLAFAKESASKGQAKFLVLDDVLQSVDSSIRLLVAEYILHEFSDWQLVFTVHDRLWLEQLRELFRQSNHSFAECEIIRWKFETGPVIISGSRDAEFSLVDALNRGDLIGICSQAGILLEKICNYLSFALPVSVTRRKGDKYTLGDLWPPVHAKLLKTGAKPIAEEVYRWLHLRNLVGAHYNDWAYSLSLQEAQLFGESIINLLHQVCCDKCYRWIEKSEGLTDGRNWVCRCGKSGF